MVDLSYQQTNTGLARFFGLLLGFCLINNQSINDKRVRPGPIRIQADVGVCAVCGSHTSHKQSFEIKMTLIYSLPSAD